MASPAPVSASSLCAPRAGGCSRRLAHDPTPRTESRPAHVRYDSWAVPRQLLAMPSVSSGKRLSVDIILKVRLSSRAGLINPLPTGAILLDTCLVIPHIHDCLWVDMASMSGLWPWPDIEFIGKRNTLICPVNLLCWTGLCAIQLFKCQFTAQPPLLPDGCATHFLANNDACHYCCHTRTSRYIVLGDGKAILFLLTLQYNNTSTSRFCPNHEPNLEATHVFATGRSSKLPATTVGAG